MKDEEMAEEYASSDKDKIDIIRTVKDWHLRKNGFLAGLKAGRPQWHKVTDGLPIRDKDKYYFVVDKMNAYMIARFYEGKWSNYSVIDDVIAWCEIPTFNKE